MVGCTFALPLLTCTARERPTLICSCCLCCEAGHLGPFVRGLSRVESPPAVFACSVVLRAVCLLPLFACHAHCPSRVLAPVHLLCALPRPFLLRLPPVHVHVRQDRRLAGPAVCLSVRASSLQATKLSRWQLQHGPAVAARAPVHLTIFFFLQSP